MIHLDAVTVHRKHGTVLDGITLTIGAEVVAVIGPSGAGKTTLLRALLGLERLSSGEISIQGVVMNCGETIQVPPESRNLGMVFQDLALWPHLSVQENLAYGLKARGLARSERARRIERALRWGGLTTKADRSPEELSGGERQRVAIARALVLEPAALLLDEPLANLDITTKNDLIHLFGGLFSERELPVLYVTHDPREAARLADRYAVIESGRLVQQGRLQELATHPATDFVRAFAAAATGQGR